MRKIQFTVALIFQVLFVAKVFPQTPYDHFMKQDKKTVQKVVK
jgi:hypothetical protein